jgi:methylphosphotriester-DNA--protein-cysteine methyltransferase
MKKRYLVPLVISVAIAIFVSFAMSAEFWASKGSNKYHYPTCKWAQKIKPDNLIKFGSPEQAVKAGYVPCRVCNPPDPKQHS